MKILFVADLEKRPDSGSAGTEYKTIQALRRLGHDVDAVWRSELSHKISHGNLHSLFEQPITYKHTMLKKLSRLNYDVIHMNQPAGYLAAKELKRLKQSIVFIHRSHGFELRVKHDLAPWQVLYKDASRSNFKRVFSSLLARALEYQSREIAQFADGHIVSASQCAEFLVNIMGVSKERVAVIPQAAPEKFLVEPVLPMPPERIKKILYVGQFAFIKAPMILAAVFDKLVINCENVELTWVCSKDHHRQASELLKAETRKKVRFLDWMPQDKLMRIYDAHGIFLFPSFFEGFGKAFLEAMSRGLCVIAADNGGMHDVINHGENGLLVPTGDVESMVKACLQVLADHNLGVTFSQAAVNTARHYTWERVAQETVQFYKNRLDAKSREKTV